VPLQRSPFTVTVNSTSGSLVNHISASCAICSLWKSTPRTQMRTPVPPHRLTCLRRTSTTSNTTNYAPGSVITHQMTVTNSATSSSAVVGANFGFNFVPTSGSLTNISWTCTASGGSACSAAAEQSLMAEHRSRQPSVCRLASLLPSPDSNDQRTKTVIFRLRPVITPPSGIVDAINSNNTAVATDHDTADLALSMTSSAGSAYTPPTTISYTAQLPTTGRMT